jgi:hypothetical protein
MRLRKKNARKFSVGSKDFLSALSPKIIHKTIVASASRRAQADLCIRCTTSSQGYEQTVPGPLKHQRGWIS